MDNTDAMSIRKRLQQLKETSDLMVEQGYQEIPLFIRPSEVEYAEELGITNYELMPVADEDDTKKTNLPNLKGLHDTVTIQDIDNIISEGVNKVLSTHHQEIVNRTRAAQSAAFYTLFPDMRDIVLSIAVELVKDILVMEEIKANGRTTTQLKRTDTTEVAVISILDTATLTTAYRKPLRM